MNNQTEQSAGEFFRSIVKGKNFMTPDLVSYERIKGGVAEITSGEFMGDKIYGVTVVRNKQHDYDAGKSFDNIVDATMYVRSLK